MKRGENKRLPKTLVSSARVVTWPVKLSFEEALDLEVKLLSFAKGNRSLYIRTALLNYKPKKEDFKC